MMSEFIFCKQCQRPSWVKSGVCEECGENIGCVECNTELISNEETLCSLCVSATEHVGDIVWE